MAALQLPEAMMVLASKGFKPKTEGAKPPKVQRREPGPAQAPQPDAGAPREVSEAVNARILSRILTFSGVPVALALCLFPLFYYLKVVQKVDLPMGLVYTVQSLVFGAGLVGITWGILSASWDPQRKGSAFGLDEVKQNFPVLWDELRKK
ncbi:hypothetical protein WJX81_004171 [Elliptochloris bilobata]|uniref:Protein PAM68, chloroplastic n=1 Tax=Elliptochloris bilobata TaxID=381761 RepID=A0AAW1RRC0_9CHLO